MKNLKELMEQREEKRQAMEDLVNTADTETRAMTQEETEQFDTLENEIKAIDETIAREKRARAISNESAINNDVEERALEEERAFTDWVLGIAENRASQQLTQTNNGAIVPTTIANKIITAIKEQVPFLQYAQVIETKGKLSVPVYTEDGTNYIKADYVDEGTDITDNVGKFTTIDLNGYVVRALALISNQLKNNTDINVTEFIVNQVAKAISSKLMKEFTVGSTKIKGVCESKQVVNAKATSAITFDELINLKRTLKQIYRTNAVWIMHPETYTSILSLKDGSGRPYFEEGKGLFNRPVIESEDMAKIATGAKAIVFGDLMAGYTIKSTSGIEVKLLKETFATKNMIGILGFAEYDAAITDEKALAVLKMA